MEFEYKEEYKYFTSACLNVTDACNLACTYCFVQQKPHYMSLDTAKNCVDFLANNIKNNKNKDSGSINFFGGEPTLLWDEIIVPITNYIKNNYKNLIHIGMTTNGTLLNEERIKFLADNNFSLLLSCDGNEYSQNVNRPCQNGQNSFELVSKNFPLILKYFPNITFRSTISNNNIDEIFNNYLFVAQQGFKSYFIMPNVRSIWTKEEIKRLNHQIQLIYSHIFSQFSIGKKPILNCDWIDKIFTNIIENDIQILTNNYSPTCINRNPYRCGLGTTSASFGYDGNIYGCQEQTSYSDGYFYIGNIFDGVNEEKHAKLLSDYNKKFTHTCETPEKCINCELQHVCQQYGCPSTNYDITGDMLISPDVECEWKKILFTNAKKIAEILVKSDNKTFQEYLKNSCNYNKLVNNAVRCY